MSYIPTFIKFINNLYDPITNVNGDIPLVVAENTLVSDLVLAKIKSFNDYTPLVLNYTSTTGMPGAKQEIARFLGEKLFKCEIDPNNIVLSSGCCSLLHSLSQLLFDVKEAVLVPTPYYPAFDHDFFDLGDVYCVEVNVDRTSRSHPFESESDLLFDEDAWNNAYNSSIEKGCNVKAILLTNPSNPLGVVYSKEAILQCIAWARSKNLHIIVDEIYGLSCFGDLPFNSVVSFFNNDISDDIHILWSFSKDLGASGLRLGVLYTQNKVLLQSMNSANDTFMVSNLMQEMAAGMLSDRAWTDNYLEEMKRRLKLSYEFLKNSLVEMGLVVVDAGGAIFAFADFSSLLKIQSFDEEKKLHQELVDIGLLFTPGQACHCQHPGYFRICYAWVKYESLIEAMRRLKIFVEKKRESM